MTFVNIITILSVLLTGLIAGLFYSYSCSVNPGLNNVDDLTYLKSMQSINRAIPNPVFFCSFIGTPVIMGIASFLLFKHGGGAAFYFMLAAFAVYFIGTFLVTMMSNVPLNNALDKIDIASSTKEQMQKARMAFEKPWNLYHLIRTVANVGAFVLTILSLFKLK